MYIDYLYKSAASKALEELLENDEYRINLSKSTQTSYR